MDDRSFTPVSDEGDVYTLPMGQNSSHRKIEGAGVYSDDSTDPGYVNSIALIGDALFVTGYHSQLYRLTDTTWAGFIRKSCRRHRKPTIISSSVI
jgi:hypothetical protein